MHSLEFNKGQAMSSPLSDKTKHRRRLLKAVAGIPAIVVLPTGAQGAVGSLTCVDKGIMEYGSNPPESVAIPDVWIREGPDPTGPYTLVRDSMDRPVAHHSCWNSLNPSGRQADSDNILR